MKQKEDKEIKAPLATELDDGSPADASDWDE